MDIWSLRIGRATRAAGGCLLGLAVAGFALPTVMAGLTPTSLFGAASVILLFGAVPGTVVAWSLGAPISILRSATGGVLGLLAGGLAAVVVMRLQLPDQIVIARVVIGSPIAFGIAGAVAAAAWSACAGCGWFAIASITVAGAAAGLFAHLAAISIVLHFSPLPGREDPAGAILAVYLASTVLAMLLGSAGMGAITARDDS